MHRCEPAHVRRFVLRYGNRLPDEDPLRETERPDQYVPRISLGDGMVVHIARTSTRCPTTQTITPPSTFRPPSRPAVWATDKIPLSDGRRWATSRNPSGLHYARRTRHGLTKCSRVLPTGSEPWGGATSLRLSTAPSNQQACGTDLSDNPFVDQRRVLRVPESPATSACNQDGR